MKSCKLCEKICYLCYIDEKKKRTGTQLNLFTIKNNNNDNKQNTICYPGGKAH